MFFGGLFIYIIGLSTEGFHSFIGKPTGFYICLGTLVFISVFAFSFWFIALQTNGSKVSDINMCRLINPILGAILSWVMLEGEYPTFSTVTGMLIIVSSLIIYFKGESIISRLKKQQCSKKNASSQNNERKHFYIFRCLSQNFHPKRIAGTALNAKLKLVLFAVSSKSSDLISVPATLPSIPKFLYLVVRNCKPNSAPQYKPLYI